MSIRFTQSCPTCGRRNQVRASLLGSRVACAHCGSIFLSDQSEHSVVEPTSKSTGAAVGTGMSDSSASDLLMARVDELLADDPPATSVVR